MPPAHRTNRRGSRRSGRRWESVQTIGKSSRWSESSGASDTCLDRPVRWRGALDTDRASVAELVRYVVTLPPSNALLRSARLDGLRIAAEERGSWGARNRGFWNCDRADSGPDVALAHRDLGSSWRGRAVGCQVQTPFLMPIRGIDTTGCLPRTVFVLTLPQADDSRAFSRKGYAAPDLMRSSSSQRS